MHGRNERPPRQRWAFPARQACNTLGSHHQLYAPPRQRHHSRANRTMPPPPGRRGLVPATSAASACTRFRAEAPDHLWCCDITRYRTGEGSLYCAVVLDVSSHRVVGWSIADHLRAEIVVDALDMIWLAMQARGPGDRVRADMAADTPRVPQFPTPALRAGASAAPPSTRTSNGLLSQRLHPNRTRQRNRGGPPGLGDAPARRGWVALTADCGRTRLREGEP